MALTVQNRFGLPRTIPEEIKRQIRQNSGFGCVVCGLGLTEYEHVDPVYVDAQEHDPSKMTLLCPNCHAKVTKKLLSKEAIEESMKDPVCKRQGYTSDRYHFMKMSPVVKIGRNVMKDAFVPIEVGGTSLIRIDQPMVDNGPFRLSAIFHNMAGAESLTIRENEWYAVDSNWDVECEGNSLVIRDGKGKISLELKKQEPNILEIAKLDMVYHNYHFKIRGGRMSVFANGTELFSLEDNQLSNFQVGISLP